MSSGPLQEVHNNNQNYSLQSWSTGMGFILKKSLTLFDYFQGDGQVSCNSTQIYVIYCSWLLGWNTG